MLQKVQIILKNTSNKDCSELNFLRKTQWIHISIFPRSWAEGLQWLPFLKYYNVLVCERRLILVLNAAKNASNKNCSELIFLQKIQWTNIFIFPRSRARKPQRFATKRGRIFTEICLKVNIDFTQNRFYYTENLWK